MSEHPLVSLSDFSVIKLAGPDAKSFLHGQVTCDVNKLSESDWLAGCHCNAKGKMWSSFILFQQADELFLIATKESAAQSLAELKKYGVFSKVEINDDSENWFVYGATEQVANAKSIELAENHYMILSSSAMTASDDATQWWQQELLSGRAHLYTSTSGEYVPQMLNLQALDYISFNKGCYIGQETVARMRYLGKNKRALYIAKSPTLLDLTIGDDVYIEINENRRSIGKVINVCQYNGETYTQLVMPKDTELSESIYINKDGSDMLNLLPLPYSLEQN